jgi:hypothetical protein
MDKIEIQNRIWSTRKCRINASERLIRNDRFLQFCNMYYSCFLTVVSVIQLKYNYENMEIFSVSLSVALVVILSYFNSQNYSERANRFKNNYIELHQLYDLTFYAYEEEKILKQYYNLLNVCENHTTIDYLTFLFNDDKLYFKIKGNSKVGAEIGRKRINWQFLLFILLKVTFFMFKAFIILVPAIVFINYYIVK